MTRLELEVGAINPMGLRFMGVKTNSKDVWGPLTVIWVKHIRVYQANINVRWRKVGCVSQLGIIQ